MLCTRQYILSVRWALIIGLYSAVNTLQHLKAIWGLRLAPKPIGKKKQTLSKTLKLVEKVPCVIKLLKQLLLEETSVVMTLADYAKLSFAFLNNGSVSTLENTEVRDVVIVKHDSTAATRKPQQMPECVTVQARTGQSWCHSTFPMAECSRIHGKAQKKKNQQHDFARDGTTGYFGQRHLMGGGWPMVVSTTSYSADITHRG